MSLIPRRLSEIDLSQRDRLVVYYLTGLELLALLYTVVYNLALARLEGVNQSLQQFGESIHALIGPGDDQQVVHLDPELGTEFRDHVSIALHADDRTAGSRSDPGVP